MTEPGGRRPERALPASLPVFPLSGALLLPRGRLPLNIFEPRYLNMVDDALAGDRLIGMVQPSIQESRESAPPLYRIGCVGRISSFAEEGERYLITLTGISRFDIVEELPTMRLYRRVVPDWQPYADDRIEAGDLGLDRLRLIAGLRGFFKRHGLSVDWNAIQAAPDERLVNLLSMICPFGAIEKQALLEAADGSTRARLLIGFVEFSSLETSPEDARH